MKYQIIRRSQIDALWELQKLYKAEIGENEPDVEGKARQRQGIGDRSVGIEIRAGCLPESGRCGQGQRERRQKQGLFHNYFHLLCVQR